MIETIDKVLENTSGILKLKPNYVTRYYMDHGPPRARRETRRHLQLRGQPLDPRTLDRLHRPGRSPPIRLPGEGLSFLDVPGKPITLKDAIAARPEAILGPALAERYAPMFPGAQQDSRPALPHRFHFHARDEDVQNFPQYFGRTN